MTLGRFLIATGTIPASSDNAKMFPLFSAPNVAVRIEYCQYYGGDANEYLQLILVPLKRQDGTLAPSAVPGTIAVTPIAYMTGGVFAQDTPNALGSDNPGRGAPRFNAFTVPPNYQLCMMQDTANSVAWVCTVGGFEVV